MLSSFDHPSPGEEAALGLASMSGAAYPALVESLMSGNPVVRRNAAWAIGELHDGGKVDRSSAVPVLVQMVGSDSDARARRAAAFALSEIKERSTSRVLITALSDDNPKVRVMAANALGEMKAADAVDALQHAAQDPDKEVRQMAGWALNEIAE
jgi:HEAT repeat protein